MYYLTVIADGQTVSDHRPFEDYAAAILACTEYYKPKFNGSMLTFTTEVVRGQFVHSYAFLDRPEDVNRDDAAGAARYSRAIKSSNGHIYNKSLFFRIDSDFALMLRKEREEEDNADE